MLHNCGIFALGNCSRVGKGKLIIKRANKLITIIQVIIKISIWLVILTSKYKKKKK